MLDFGGWKKHNGEREKICGQPEPSSAWYFSAVYLVAFVLLIYTNKLHGIMNTKLTYRYDIEVERVKMRKHGNAI